jgi:histidinol-phosphate/aromatic aminotransferase/cobyric acid decarboxylase-like protein
LFFVIFEDGPNAEMIVAKCKRTDLYIRDVANMGKSFNKHTIRIAIKDRETNQKMQDLEQRFRSLTKNTKTNPSCAKSPALSSFN